MQITLKCKVSLSKKMRNLLQNGGSIVLTADSINSGKGEGLLVLTDNNNGKVDISDLLGNETSVMITPTEESSNGAPPVTQIYQTTSQNSPGVSQVFNPQYQQPLQEYPPQYSQPPQRYQDPQAPRHTQQAPPQQRTAVDRMAAQHPTDNHNRSYYTQDELVVPQGFEHTQDPDFVSYVKSYQELMQAVNESKDKDCGIRVDEINEFDPIHLKRQKALLKEQKDMQESIGRDAYVVNEKCASLTINDIGLDLPLMMPKNLGNISAKKLASSRQLWELFRQKFIRLVSPNEADHLLKNASTINQTYVPELEIYDSRYDAEDTMYQGGVSHETRATILDLESDLDGDTEEMSNLRMAGSSRRPPSGGSVTSLSGNTRTSFHGSNNLEDAYLADIFAGEDFKVSDRHIGRESRRNEQGVKTVASRHSRRRD